MILANSESSISPSNVFFGTSRQSSRALSRNPSTTRTTRRASLEHAQRFGTGPEPSPNSAVAPDANRCFTVLQEPSSSRAVRAGEPRAVRCLMRHEIFLLLVLVGCSTTPRSLTPEEFELTLRVEGVDGTRLVHTLV